MSKTGLGIGDDRMECITSGHTAARVGPDGWVVDWLPNRVFTRNEAISALTAAEQVAAHPEPDWRVGLLVKSLLTDELGLSAYEWPYR